MQTELSRSINLEDMLSGLVSCPDYGHKEGLTSAAIATATAGHVVLFYGALELNCAAAQLMLHHQALLHGDLVFVCHESKPSGPSIRFPQHLDTKNNTQQKKMHLITRSRDSIPVEPLLQKRPWQQIFGSEVNLANKKCKKVEPGRTVELR
jgi:hypothetical protein